MEKSPVSHFTGLTLIPAWKSNYIHYTVWDEITQILCDLLQQKLKYLTDDD